MCERSSKFLPGPLSHAPFKVDDFTKGGLVYFLTHAHTDHLRGLRDSWQGGKIYCTEVTQKLIMLKYPGLNERLFRTLSVGETKLIVLNDKYSLCVTVLDAIHCAGSCMFLFESKHFGRVLHTGDFRYELGQSIPRCLLESDEGSVTSVYLDNTYGLQSSPKNPARKEVKDVLVALLRLYPAQHRFVFCMHGLGKEELLVEAAKALNTKVLVDGDRMEQIHAFGDEDLAQHFTTDVRLKESCRVVCVRRGRGGRLGEENELEPDGGGDTAAGNDETANFRQALDIGNENDIFITPSGWCGMASFENMKHLLKQEAPLLPRNIKVPYSLHASYIELVRFVKECRFKYVIPIVNVSATDRDELGIESIAKRWNKPMVCAAENEDEEEEDKEAWNGIDAISTVKPHHHVMASPKSHHRRLEMKRSRFQRPIGNGEEEEDIEVIFRREFKHCDQWSKEEDEILRVMMHKRRLWDCGGHETERRKLRKRSDNEIFVRLTTFRLDHK